MNKKFALIFSIFTLFISSYSVANSSVKKYYEGYTEIPQVLLDNFDLRVHGPDIFGMEQDNDHLTLISVHIKYFTDRSCTKNKKITRNSDFLYDVRSETPHKKTFTFLSNDNKVVVKNVSHLCQ